ncbi:MAG: hypothetical protein LBS19_07050 [Clostridiales bacterium]|jgi:hypothetical protein|nr:hypothetical protein [Clostridiales bacterium]
MPHRINKTLGIIILVVSFSVITGGVGYIAWYSSQQPHYFVIEKKSLGDTLYRRLQEYDLENYYPETAEEVMEINNLLRRLMYGNIVADKDFIRVLVGYQRMLFDDVLLEANSLDTQTQKVIESGEMLYRNKISLYSSSIGTVFESDEVEMCIAPITEAMVNYEGLYWNYYLKKDADGRWKIYTWERTDRSFRNVIEDGAPEGFGIE